MQCLLCSIHQNKLSKAHIFPKGFFNKLPLKRNVQTIHTTGQDGRKLQNAIYDTEILCCACESRIMSPLDDYAIRILRDKKGAFPIDPKASEQFSFWIFENVNKRKIRAFIASLLWRSSVSKQLELNNIEIGADWEATIRENLVNNGEFAFVDCVVSYLTDPIHGAFLMPASQLLHPIDTARDHDIVNGWHLQMPNISMSVSLDNRQHPHRWYMNFDPSITGRNEKMLCSTSLHPKDINNNLLAFERPKEKLSYELLINSVLRD